MRDFIDIGGAPADEPCAQVRKDRDVQDLNQLECKAYINALCIKYGEPPEGCRYVVHGNRHDFGTYYEVRITYDVEKPECREYAFKVENGLATWHEVGMWPPVTYDAGEAVLIMADPDLWLREKNPGAYPTIDRRDAARTSEPPG